MEPRLILSHVCSVWREVALDTPKLWTDITLSLRRLGLSVHRHAIISAWLSRSSPCPVSLQVYHSAGESFFENLILPNLRRCRNLDLETLGAELQQLLSLPTGTLSDLEDIQIYAQSRAIINAINHGRITAFQGCPKPWVAQVAQERVNISPTSCLDVLRECISLQECDLSISHIDDDSADKLTTLSKQPLLLPSLHTLSLGLINHVTLFLAALNTPSLRAFSPMGRWNNFPWSPSSLTSLFLRLDTLNLSRIITWADDDLSGFLRPLQQLTGLCFPLLDQLTDTALRDLGSGTLVPSVTSIAFGLLSIEALIHLLEKRLVASRTIGEWG
ncbi:hypothetical protein BD779DRAFT_1805441 [Infundibulicybe gibba]|nr:hypothetical protein BD779DRAFT_1805441 [Infundibulicybe gibba]